MIISISFSKNLDKLKNYNDVSSYFTRFFSKQKPIINKVLNEVRLTPDQILSYIPNPDRTFKATTRRLRTARELFDFYEKFKSQNYQMRIGNDGSLYIIQIEFDTKSPKGARFSYIFLENPARPGGYVGLSIRYDYDPQRALIGHPANHIHFIGNDPLSSNSDNELRIGIDQILTPLSFIMLILRFYFKEEWKKLWNGKSGIYLKYLRDKQTPTLIYLEHEFYLAFEERSS